MQVYKSNGARSAPIRTGICLLLLAGIMSAVFFWRQPRLLNPLQTPHNPITNTETHAARMSVAAALPDANLPQELADLGMPDLYTADGALDFNNIRLLLDFFLSDNESLATQKQRTCQHLENQAKPAERILLQDICERYFAYRQEWYNTADNLQPADKTSLMQLQLALNTRESIQRRWFSAEEQEKLFARQNTYDQWMITRMQTPAAQRLQLDMNMQQKSEYQQADEIRHTEAAQKALQADAAQFAEQVQCYQQYQANNAEQIQNICHLTNGQWLRIQNALSLHP